MKKSFDRKSRPGGGGGRSFEGRPSGGGERRFGGGQFSPGQRHSAVCGQCGARCEVPFKPTNNRPVLCNDCFRKDGPSDSGGGYSRPAPQGEPDQTQKQLRIINTKLDKILSILEELDFDEDEDEGDFEEE